MSLGMRFNKKGESSESGIISDEQWSIKDLCDRYNVTPEVIHRTFLPLGLPYSMEQKGLESEQMIFSSNKVTDWELKTKCIGCGKGLPGCGLLPAFRDFLIYRKREPSKTALYLFCYLLSIYLIVFTPHILSGYAALSVFTVCLYDQSMRKGSGKNENG